MKRKELKGNTCARRTARENEKHIRKNAGRKIEVSLQCLAKFSNIKFNQNRVICFPDISCERDSWSGFHLK
jgi:hypothetical protein